LRPKSSYIKRGIPKAKHAMKYKPKKPRPRAAGYKRSVL